MPGVVEKNIYIASGICSLPEAEISQPRTLGCLRLKAPPAINTTLATTAFNEVCKLAWKICGRFPTGVCAEIPLFLSAIGS
jgi:hypothetical protein